MQQQEQKLSSEEIANIFAQEYKLGDLVLPNKLIMASLTRIRCDPKTGVPNDLLIDYYSQRASAGLILILSHDEVPLCGVFDFATKESELPFFVKICENQKKILF